MAFDKVIDSSALDGALTTTADAIRAKTRGTDKILWDNETGFASAVSAITTGDGGKNTIDELLTGVLTNLESDLETVCERALWYNPTVRSLNFPNLTSMGMDAFAQMPNLVSASLPAVTKGGSRMFWNCINLESVYLPNITYIENMTFYNTKVSCIPNMTNITDIKDGAFEKCTFQESNIILPSIEALGYNVFKDSKGIKLVDLGVNLIKVIGKAHVRAQVFCNCSDLKTVILRSPYLCTLENVNAFTGTPFTSGGTGGTVYVPSELIESYQTATNWSALYAAGSCSFVAIEGSEYE